MEGQGRLQSRNVKISSQGFSRKILRKNVDRKATESGGGGKHSYYPIFLHFNYSEICHSISRRMLRQRQRVGSRDRFLLGRILLPVPPAITIKKKIFCAMTDTSSVSIPSSHLSLQGIFFRILWGLYLSPWERTDSQAWQRDGKTHVHPL